MKERTSLSELKERQPKSIERLYLLNFPLIIQFITENKGSMDEARRVFHDSIFVLLEEIDADESGIIQDTQLWLYSIAKVLWNDVLDEKRMDKSSVVDCHDFMELDEKTILGRIQRVRNLEARFKVLPEPGRTIVRDHYAHGISLVEIAQRMGFSEELSAEKHKLKALKKLIDSGL